MHGHLRPSLLLHYRRVADVATLVLSQPVLPNEINRTFPHGAYVGHDVGERLFFDWPIGKSACARTNSC